MFLEASHVQLIVVFQGKSFSIQCHIGIDYRQLCFSRQDIFNSLFLLEHRATDKQDHVDFEQHQWYDLQRFNCFGASSCQHIVST